jgi:PAS domain S-box-containing protein
MQDIGASRIGAAPESAFDHAAPCASQRSGVDPRVSQDCLKLLEAGGGVGFDCYDLDTGLVSPSPGFCQIYGLDSTESRPLGFFQSFVHPADRHTGQFGEFLIRSGARLTRDMRIIRADGFVRWLSFRGEVVLGQDLRPNRVLGIWTDVTYTRAAAEVLQQSRMRFQALALACGAVVWTALENGTQVAMDLDAWCRLTGQPREAAVDSGWLDMLHPQDRDRLREAWLQCCVTGANLDINARLIRPGGSDMWLNVRAKALRNEDGKIVEWLGVITAGSPAGTTSPGLSIGGPRVQLTSEQVRAARGLLGWSGIDLARASKVSISTIRRLEEQGGPLQIRHRLQLNIRQAFEKAGIEFIFETDAAPGVRPR